MDPGPRSKIHWKEIITGIQDTDHIAVLRIRMDPGPRSKIHWKEIITGIQDTDHI
jgi:hypothetical protein